MSKTTADLRESLFDSIERVKSGKLSATDAKSVAELARGIVDTGRLDLEVAEHRLAVDTAEKSRDIHEVRAIDITPTKKAPAEIDKQKTPEQKRIESKKLSDLDPAIAKQLIEAVKDRRNIGHRASEIAQHLNVSTALVTEAMTAAARGKGNFA